MSKIHPAWDKRRKCGDRFDGTLIKELDSMHIVTPVLYPNRCDNEAYFTDHIDITNVRNYIKQKNESEALVRYSVFQIIITAVIKILHTRPKMNRFVANRLMYQRNEVTASFVVKKMFSDEGAEALAIINTYSDDTIETIHEKISGQITSGRSQDIDKSSENMDIVSKMPRRLTRAFCHFICLLDKIGHCPKGLIDTDPYYTSVVLTNLGSIGLNAGYHHLTNWGTTSLFVVVGKITSEEVVQENGTKEMHEFIDIGITLDERLADGYYYSKTLKLLNRLLQSPELLEKPMGEIVK